MPDTEPRRVQLSRAAGWRMPENTKKVDRSTIWGNPFRIGADVSTVDGTFPIADNAMAVTLFRDLVLRDGGFINGGGRHPATFVSLADVQRELGGKNLACWCRLSDACHADVLLELANEGAPS